MKKSKNKSRTKSKYNKVSIILIALGIIVLGFYGYIIFRGFQSSKNLISITVIPLILGIVFENKRLSASWKEILYKIMLSLTLSLFVFAPGKKETTYVLEDHIAMWPYFFIFFFVLASAVIHEKKITPKLTEGITLLQSISIIYLMIDIGLFNNYNVVSIPLIIIGLSFCTVSFVHAFSYLKLTNNTRLFLSIWSSIIMIIFAIEYMIRVFTYNFSSKYTLLDEGIHMLQYFLLGVSLIYIFQNAIMLLEYLPSKNRAYNKEHMKDIDRMNKTHISRYSKRQTKISDALLALFLTGGIYFLNYSYRFIPRYTMIWLLFWIFPFIITLKHLILGKPERINTFKNK